MSHPTRRVPVPFKPSLRRPGKISPLSEESEMESSISPRSSSRGGKAGNPVPPMKESGDDGGKYDIVIISDDSDDENDHNKDHSDDDSISNHDQLLDNPKSSDRTIPSSYHIRTSNNTNNTPQPYRQHYATLLDHLAPLLHRTPTLQNRILGISHYSRLPQMKSPAFWRRAGSCWFDVLVAGVSSLAEEPEITAKRLWALRGKPLGKFRSASVGKGGKREFRAAVGIFIKALEALEALRQVEGDLVRR